MSSGRTNHSNMIPIGFGLRLHSWLAFPIISILLVLNNSTQVLGVANIDLGGSAGFPLQEPAVPYQDAMDITNMPDLIKFRKTVGMNKGMEAQWSGIRHYLKLETPDHQRLLELYNIRFVRENLGAFVPNAQFVTFENKLYLAKDEVFGYTGAAVFKGMSKPRFRKRIEANLGGEANVARLLVCGTLISDLTLENWGFSNLRKGLVLIDVDGGKNLDGSSKQPKAQIEYLELARNFIMHDPSRLYLSLQNIQGMKKIYEEMLMKPVPVVDPAVDMSQEFYHQLIQGYLDVCNFAIARIHREFPNVDPAEVNDAFNLIFTDGLHEQMDFVKSGKFKPSDVSSSPKFSPPKAQPQPQPEAAQPSDPLATARKVLPIAGIVSMATSVGLFAASTIARCKRKPKKNPSKLQKSKSSDSVVINIKKPG
jgi:hypothetical protein